MFLRAHRLAAFAPWREVSSFLRIIPRRAKTRQNGLQTAILYPLFPKYEKPLSFFPDIVFSQLDQVDQI